MGIVRLNRPEVLNAFNREMTRELQEALDELNADAAIGAIVTTGNGRAYSSGSDIGGGHPVPTPVPRTTSGTQNSSPPRASRSSPP